VFARRLAEAPKNRMQMTRIGEAAVGTSISDRVAWLEHGRDLGRTLMLTFVTRESIARSRRRLTASAYECVRAEILQRRLPPGTVLTERAMTAPLVHVQDADSPRGARVTPGGTAGS
jgi:hypothetical protein